MFRFLLLATLFSGLPLLAQTRRDACALATLPELSAAMGMPMFEGKPTGFREPECQWRSQSFQVVTIRVHPGAALELESYSSKAGQKLHGKPEPAPHLSEGATYVRGVVTMACKRDLVVIALKASLLSPEEQKRAAVAIANSVLLHYQ